MVMGGDMFIIGRRRRIIIKSIMLARSRRTSPPRIYITNNFVPTHGARWDLASAMSAIGLDAALHAPARQEMQLEAVLMETPHVITRRDSSGHMIYRQS